MVEVAVDVVVSGYGRWIGVSGDCLEIHDGTKVISTIPVFRVRSITLEGRGVSISSDAVVRCAQEGITVIFSSRQGVPEAMLATPYFHATVELRRAQIKALDSTVGTSLAKRLVAAKVMNQVRLLKYAYKNRSVDNSDKNNFEQNINSLKRLAQEALSVQEKPLAEVRNKLMGLEGTAGRIYWDLFKKICAYPFPGRVHRGARDPINSALNYGYGILYRVVWSAVLKAGLEPFAGLLHTDRAGKPSMVLDAIEEFRAPIVDRCILAIANRGQPIEVENNFLTRQSRSVISKEVLRRLESRELYKGERLQVYSIIVRQCREIAAHLRGEREYKPYKFKW